MSRVRRARAPCVDRADRALQGIGLGQERTNEGARQLVEGRRRDREDRKRLWTVAGGRAIQAGGVQFVGGVVAAAGPTPSGWRGRVDAVSRAITRQPAVSAAMAVLGIANDAGAPLLAAALAFNAIFAIVPGLLLLSGILGWAIEDVESRTKLLNDLVALLPPLRAAILDSLNGVVRERGGLTIVGLVGLLWGASSFYGALDEVMRRIFAGGPVRGFIEQRVRGLLSVIGLVAIVAVTVLTSGIWTVVVTSVGALPGAAVALTVAGPLLLVAFSVIAVLLVYVLVPTAPPGWRAAWLPAVVAGLGIGLLTSVFSALAPILVGGLAGFGVIATVFGALVWLNLGFQILLYGAAWARLRREREKEKQKGLLPA